MAKQTKYAKSAKGKPCSLRLIGCSPGPDNETVVLAHINLFGNGGMAMKAKDIHGVYSCYNCHKVIDGPVRNHFHTEILRALLETQNCMVEDGILII